MKDTQYEAIVAFTDEIKGCRVGYNPGDDYPKAGYEPNNDRLTYLLSDHTSFGKPVIKAKDGQTGPEPTQEPELEPQMNPKPESAPKLDPAPKPEKGQSRKK